MFFLLKTRFKLKYALSSVVLFCIIFQSCKEPKEYRVNSSFSVYLKRFESEAAVRGYFFDLKSNGLIIEFANLSNGIAGLTHFEDPIRIEIDKSYWDNISKSAGADLMKEDLMFHELGHGLLNRKHLNTILPNGDWKSMMCGGDKVNNRPWNINYHGLRRNYYINELFDEHAKAPDSIRTDLFIDTIAYNDTVLHYNFDTFSKWSIGDSVNYTTSIAQGRFCFQSKMKQQLSYMLKTKIDFQQDFSLEIKMECPSENLESQYGLVFGSMLDKTNPTLVHSLEYITINNHQLMLMGNSGWYSYFTALSRPEIISKGINVLKISKKGKFLYYFINQKYIYCNELEAIGVLNYVGFVIPPKSFIYIDDLLIAQKAAMPVSNRRQQIVRQSEPEIINSILLYRELSPIR